MATEQPGLLSTILFPRSAAERRGQARREGQLEKAAPLINQARFGNSQGSQLALQELSKIDNPTVQQIGANQAQRLQSAIGNRMTPLQQEAELTSSQNRNFNSQLQPGRVEAQANALELQRQSIAAGNTLPQLDPTSFAFFNPLTQQPQIADIAGPQKAVQQGAMDASFRALGNANQYMGLVNEFGSEIFGPAAVEMDQLQFGIQTAAVQMAGAGAPQGIELELVGKGLPSATGFGQNIRGAAQAITPGANAFRNQQIATISAGYQSFARQVSQSIVDQLRLNPSLSISTEQFNQIDPRVWKSPDERAFFEANTGTNFLMQQLQ